MPQAPFNKTKMMKKWVVLIFTATLLGMILLSCAQETQLNIQYVFTEQSGSVILNCSHDMEGRRKWKYQGEPLYLDRNYVAIHARDRMKLSSRYSLLISPVFVADEGVFECFHGSAVVEHYNLTVTVSPHTYITINGQNSTDLVYVKEAKTFVAVCHAKGSRPAASFTWLISDENLITSAARTEIFASRKQNDTFDSRSTVEVLPYTLGGNISCITQAPGWRKKHSLIRFETFVKPWVYLMIDGKDANEEICVLAGQKITVSCFAIGARPSVKLALKVNEKHIKTVLQITPNSKREINRTGTFDTNFEVVIEPTGTNDTITCETVGGQEDKESIQLSYCKTAGSEKTKITIALIVSLTTSSIVLAFFAYIWKYYRGSKGKSTSSFQSETGIRSHQVDDEYLAPLSTGAHTNPFNNNDTRRELSSLEKRLTILNLDSTVQRPKGEQEGNESASNGEGTGPPDLKLPDIPADDDYGDYTTLPEYGYYSKTIARRARGKIFQRKDICFIVSMKEGCVYNRWMGTIATPNKSNKCVVISSLTDKLLRTKEIQWDVYVKEVLELPSNTSNIVRCEGICIDSGALFLLQEHITGESLTTHIKTNTSIEPKQLVKYCMDTLKGIEYIHSYGFLHPGLSTNKILVPNNGECKLYDFCLKDDAPAITIILKEKTFVSLNIFAPEAIRRNEYSWESDVWSIGVVIWEILTNGDHPFPQEENKSGICDIEGQKPTQWPECSSPLRNHDLFFDCWKVEIALRPSLKHLKACFDQGLDVQRSEPRLCRESNVYSTMAESLASSMG